MADFFDQICEVLAENGKKHPGRLTSDRSVQEFFAAVSKPEAPLPPVPPPVPAAPAPVPVSSPAPPPAPIPVRTDRFNDLESLARSIRDCRNCRLCAHRHSVVFGEGNPDARLMFVGEAPGYDEDMQGRPFVGKSGQLLDKMIAAMKFTREEVYIANVIKCRPDNNRAPAPDEIAACIPMLHRQIALIRPEVIVCLGASAAKALLNTVNGISRMRGKWCSFENIPVMPTFHPAFLLRQESAKRDAWHDLQLVMARLAR